MISNLDQRMVFDNALNLANSQGYDLSHAICSQGVIRSEVAITSAQQYQLPILVNQQTLNGATPRILNIPLQLQDIFYCSQLLIGWTVASATATDGKIYTYPNATAAGSAGATTAMQTLYNGRFSLQMDNRNILPNWDIARHWQANQTQQNTNFNVAAPTSPAQYTIDQLDLSEDGFYPVEPGLILNGGGNINAQISLPGSIGTIPTNAAIVVLFRGILIQNSTTVK
jgi:hypothetical protein